MRSGWLGKSTSSPEETMQLGQKFSSYIEEGDVYALNGNLGTGKTTFIKGVLKGLNYSNIVTSPTFTLVNEYNSKFSIIHIDCYREASLDRWIKLGINDYMNEKNIVFIEWADKIDSLLPSDTINLEFVYKNQLCRKIYIK